MNPKNILFITSDQMRFDAIGANGNSFISTPNLDRLAKEGINFTNAFSPCPVCVPARFAITTGSYPHKCAGAKDNTKNVLRPEYPKLGEQFAELGYRTYAMGKLHYPYTPPGESRTTYGFQTVELAEEGRVILKYDPSGQTRQLEDYHDYLQDVGWGGYSRGNGLGNNDVFAAATPIPAEHYVDTWVADRTLHHLGEHLSHHREQPFFMWASFTKPHSAFDPPRPYDAMYDPRELPASKGTSEMLKDRGLDYLYQDRFKYDWDKLSPEASKVIKAHYYGLITHQDEQIGRLLSCLEEQGILEDTIIVYTADHGEMLGDFGLYFKRGFYDGSVHIPFMIRNPKLAEGLACEHLVGLQDVLPTLMAMSGATLAAAATDGFDLTPAITEDRPVREFYVSYCGSSPNLRYMLADRDWKYIYHEYGGVEELYSRTFDPDELVNLASAEEHEPVRARMNQLLTKWCEENEDSEIVENGQLKRMDRIPDFQAPKKKQPFGRRFY